MENNSSTSRLPGLLPILLGATVGVAGLLLAQKIMAPSDDDPGADSGAPAGRLQLDVELAEARAEVERLGRENRKLKGDLAAARKPEGDTVITAEPIADEADGEQGPGAVMKAMMEFGAQDAKRKIDGEVAQLATLLNLTEAQQEEVRAALLAKLEKQQAAGLLMMQGKATIADLAASDEDNFAEVDAAMAGILSESQMEEYAAYQHEREEKRVEKKANEDLDGLQQVADLSEEQADQAWDLFVQLNAADKPGEIPPDLSMEDFEGWIDEAIGKRLDGLGPILDAEQLQAYRGQTDTFREMITALISGGTGAE